MRVKTHWVILPMELVFVIKRNGSYKKNRPRSKHEESKEQSGRLESSPAEISCQAAEHPRL